MRSPAGRRIVGGMFTKAQESMRGCPAGSCQGLFVLFGQCGVHLVYPLLDL